MCGMTSLPATVALNSLVCPWMASCKWQGVIHFTFKFFDALITKFKSLQGEAYSGCCVVHSSSHAHTSTPGLAVLDFRCEERPPTKPQAAPPLAGNPLLPSLTAAQSAEAQAAGSVLGFVFHWLLQLLHCTPNSPTATFISESSWIYCFCGGVKAGTS